MKGQQKFQSTHLSNVAQYFDTVASMVFTKWTIVVFLNETEIHWINGIQGIWKITEVWNGLD